MVKRNKITTVSFDVDGTLVSPAFADLIWLEVLPQMVSDSWKIGLDEAKSKLFADFESVGYQRIEWYDLQYWLKRYRIDINARNLVLQYKSAVTFYPEVIDVLKKLKEQYDLIVISNSTRLFLDVTTDGLKPYFKRVVSTISDLGTMKDTEAYLSVSKMLGVNPYEIAHVGDNMTLDYIRAKKAGLRAFYLDRTGHGGRSRRFVRDLREFAMRIA